MSTVAAVRTFHRFYTRLAGVLADQHLGTGLPLGQARVLFEIAQLAPVQARALQACLGLDAGYLSRRLAELEAAGLIERAPSATDRRAKDILLTASGRRRLTLLDRRSDAAAGRLLQRLDADGLRRLEQAMREIQRLLGDPVEIAPWPAGAPESRACLHAYFAELARRFPAGFDPRRSVSAEPEDLHPPRGAFLLVRCGGLPRGCGAVKRIGPRVGEIKRMWIHPELRGRGAGRQLLRALEAEAAQLGLAIVRLDTSRHLPEAIALYRAEGYREIAPYNDNPYAAHWFEKTLATRLPPRK